MEAKVLNKKRMLSILVIFSVLLVLLLFRIFWIQVIEGEWYSQKAFEQQNQGKNIPAKRGTIYDRNMKELAVSASVEQVIINPTAFRKGLKGIDIYQVADELVKILNVDREDVIKKLNKGSRYEVLKRRVEKEIADQVRKFVDEKKIEGLYAMEDTKRFYPNRNLAAHVIGFSGEDNQGLDGIERIMDQYLRGMPGKILSEVDAGGREVPFYEEKRIDPKDGWNVVLTIDETIQHFAQKALEKAVADNKVLNGAAAIVIDPRNGEILALVSNPDFDPNDPKAAPPGVDPTTWKGTTKQEIEILSKTVWRDKIVSDTYEPGSTFKAITSVAGLEEGVVQPDSSTSDFTIKVSGKNINCWKPNAHGNETFLQGVYNSCNPVFVKVAQSLGIDRFYKYVKAFGFQEKTGITLPGEAESIFHAKPIEIDMAVASFGQRFQITPIQLVTAYNAIINGGKLIKPTIVKELTNGEGVVVKKFEPEVIRTTISRKTSDTIRTILEGVVSEGTGKNAYVKGYRVGGKTGTSETTTQGKYIASFCGFAPANNPVVTVLVILDNPTGDSYFGGQIAAPVAGKIIDETLTYLKVERNYSDKDREMLAEEIYIPDLRGKTVEEAKKKLKEAGLEYKIESQGEDDKVVFDQMPKHGVNVAKKSLVVMYTYKTETEKLVSVPDVKNRSISDVTQILNNAGLNIKAVGMGSSVAQTRNTGEMIPIGSIVEVEFKHLVTD